MKTYENSADYAHVCLRRQKIFLVSPNGGLADFLTSYLLSPPICRANRPLRGLVACAIY